MFSGSRALSIVDRRLAAATKRAWEAAGGLAACTGPGLSNAHLSRCGNVQDQASITIRNAVRIDTLGAGIDGHPEILSAMARELGAIVILLPDADGSADGLMRGVCDLTIEVGDVAHKIRDAFCHRSAGGAEVTPAEAEAALIEVAELERKTATLRHQLEHIAEQPP